MFIKFNEEAQKLLKRSQIEMQKLKHSFIGSEHLILSILNSKCNLSLKLNEYGVSYDNFKCELIKAVGYGKCLNNYYIYTPLLKRVLANSIIESKEMHLKEVSIETIFLMILDEGEGVAVRLLNNLGINIDSLYDELNTREVRGNINKLLINECGFELTKKAKDNEFDPLIGRDNEVNEIIQILLRKNKNNPLLVGEAGVGKTAIVEELANRIVKGNVPNKLKNCKIYSLSMASCVAGTKYRGEFEERITKMLKEIEKFDNIILFIDEIHTLVGAGGAEGAIDASNILKPSLARGKIKLIGATTIKEYRETISKDKALNRRFQLINILEPDLMETKNILYKIKNIYEDFHNVSISNDVIDFLVETTDKYIQDKKNPDKSIDVLDEVCVKVSMSKDRKKIYLDRLKDKLSNIKNDKKSLIINHAFNDASLLRDEEMKIESTVNKMELQMESNKKRDILINDVCKIIESKSNVPIYDIDSKYNSLSGMVKYLKNKIVGQDEAIDLLVKNTQKIMMGLKDDLPSSFLFVGGSGVGKTMLVKEYSSYLNRPLIRLDMSEYKESHTISKIIGSPPGYVGYDDNDNVLEKVRNCPYSIILLDEIEKANSDVINLFYQVLDEGIMTNSHNEKISFKNTIIIMTSNIGMLNDNIGFLENKKETNLNSYLSIPFINRINYIIYFNKLNKNNIIKIIKNRINYLNKKYNRYNVKFKLNEKILEKIINDSEYKIYGARKLNKILNELYENSILDNIIYNKKKCVHNL